MKYNYDDLLDNLQDGVYFVDLARRIIFWNKAAEAITGYSSAEVVGSCCSDNILVHVDAQGNNLCLSQCPLAKVLSDGSRTAVDVFVHHKQGYRIPVKVRTMPLRDESGTVVGAAELFTDDSSCYSLSEKVEELEKRSLLDKLTGLSNRANVEAELEAAFQEMKRFGTSFGVLFLDIDHFKRINDDYGHDAGDLVLQTVANTITHISRPFDLIGRWGGEEFVGIIRHVRKEALIKAGNRFRALIEKTFVPLDGGQVRVTVSLGGTMVRKDDTMESLIKRADSLMYTSKQNGRNRLTTD